MFAISVLVAGCVLPQHRGVATFCNGWVFGGGLALGVMESSAASSPNAWRGLDQAAANVAAALMLLGAAGEVLTIALHHDDPDPAVP